MVSVSLKALAADPTQAGVKKTDQFRVDPRIIEEEEGFNLRDYDDPEVVEQIEAFAHSYMLGLYVPPLIVRTTDDGRIVPVEGHLRRRGALLAIKRGAELPYVDCVPFRGSDSERVGVMLRSAQGLKLRPLKVAEGYLRLFRMGFDSTEIAARVGKTKTRVEQLLDLANANADVHALVRDGHVAADAAIDAVRRHGERAGEMLQDQLEKLQGNSEAGRREGRATVTRSVMKGPAAPGRSWMWCSRVWRAQSPWCPKQCDSRPRHLRPCPSRSGHTRPSRSMRMSWSCSCKRRMKSPR